MLPTCQACKPQRAFQSDLRTVIAVTGIVQPKEFRTVTRAQIWLDALSWKSKIWLVPASGISLPRSPSFNQDTGLT